VSTDRYPEVDRVITCVDCGENAHLVTPLPDDEDLYPGDVLVYRCEACLDRWDIIYDPNDELD